MYAATSAIVSFLDYKFANNFALTSTGPDVYQGSANVVFASSCGPIAKCFNECDDQVNFGYGHLMCVGCVKEMPQDWSTSTCKSLKVSSTVTSKSSFENALITGNTINIAIDFKVNAEIVILDVTGLIVDGHGFMINGGAANRIFYISNTGTELMITDLTFTNGYASTASYGGQFGGAVYVGSGVTLTMIGCKLLNNLADAGYGGALNLGRDLAGSTTGIKVTLTSCTFSGNSVLTNGYGGGLFIGAGVIVTITDCAFTSNVGAYSGGGICQYLESTATLTRVTFTSNSASSYGGGYFMGGPASCISTLYDCIFTSNTAATGGRGGGVSLSSNMWCFQSSLILSYMFTYLFCVGVAFGLVDVHRGK